MSTQINFKHPGFLVPLITAILYLFGTTFYAGFLRKFGIEESQFPLTFDAILFHGFYSFTDLIASSLVYIIVSVSFTAILATLVIVGLFFIDDYVKSRISARLNISKAKHGKDSKFENKIEVILKLYTYFIYFILFLFGSLVILVLAGKSGEKYADIYANKIDSGGYIFNELILKNKPEPYITYPVACNNSECAYYSNSKVQVIQKSEILSQKISIKKLD